MQKPHGAIYVTGADHEYDIPALRSSPNVLDSLLDGRLPRGEHAEVAELIHNEPACDALDRCLARRIHVRDRNVVGSGERGGQLRSKMARPRIKVRLEKNMDAPTRVPLAHRSERLGDLGRVVSVVVDDDQPIKLVHLETPACSSEAAERLL
ncbi:MAG TPA: hypothetical protein VGG88_06980, partial [Gaiellaceae bacterium]